MSETPRTDKHVADIGADGLADGDFARQLERDLAAAQARVEKPSARDVLAERERQVSQEGWTPEHDDAHAQRELARAAACYILPVLRVSYWPWHDDWWKPREYRRNLVRAAALILAEIDRVDRKQAALAEDRHE